MLLSSHQNPRPRRREGRPARGSGVGGLALPLAGCLVLLVLCSSHYGASSSHRRHGMLPSGSGSGVGVGAAGPSVTILSAPLPPPEGSPSPARLELAVRSWLALPGNVSVVLLGAHPSAHDLAGKLGGRVTVDTAVDLSFTGTPFFHSMVARAQAADSDISVLVDAEIVLLPETATLLKHFSKSDRDWFIFSMSRNSSEFPYHLADSGRQWMHADGKDVSLKKLQEIQSGNWAANGTDRGLIVAWNNPRSALVAGVTPSFLNGRGVHNRWLINEVLSSETRLVFDASNLVLGLCPENFSAKQDFSSSRNASSPAGSWEHTINRHLAALYGSYCYELPRIHTTMLYKVVKEFGDYLLSKVEEPNLSDSVTNKEQNALAEEGRLCKRGSSQSATVSLPYSLEMLLQLAADRNRSIVLAVAGASYRDMLMSWVCRLRHLRVTNFVVCALDQETYEFSVCRHPNHAQVLISQLQGLPVFRDPLSPKNVSFDDCHFGTQCFQQVTKVKSRIVLKIIRLGYNVLLSDVDVYWFHNPVPVLHSLGPATFAAQSDEFNGTGPINLPRRLNSGFYYARSDAATITAIEMVVKHATNSGLSEQPSFYDVLCGKDGVNRIGGDKCLEPNTNLTVVFLSRDLFPNGAYRGLWQRHDVLSACRELGCLIIHNNWVRGRRKKLQRQMASGLWDYDPSSRLCLQNWSDASRFSLQNDEPASTD
ncbi:hypothetical protein GUJ93_ZPchr0005g16113 [Zizania palustris]|uniref:Nucleotide-diphospho-sugar transferase domain-containing protein n=1 Tax=Zizania palustris TaxID=103762 RepID=A0A8J5SS95_ZIZPA|nr:hypothetical protein GUJ93_ZPchr0005g16113 [Zizania palustris]